MSLKGGYQLVNLKLKEFDSTIENSYKFPELYYDILNSHSKMSILSGLALDGVKYNDYEVIFYEKTIENEICFQCILRRVWDTKNLKCTTKYLTIYPNDIVKTHKEEFTYEILPDNSLSLTSENAVQNKVITSKLNYIEQKIDAYRVNNDQVSVFRWSGEGDDTLTCTVIVRKIGSFCEVYFSNFTNPDSVGGLSFGSFDDDCITIGGDKYKIYSELIKGVRFNYEQTNRYTIDDCSLSMSGNKIHISFNEGTSSDITISGEYDWISLIFPIYKI